MKENTIYKLMIKRIIFYNIILIALFKYVTKEEPMVKVVNLILILDFLLILIEGYKKSNYPFYCYIYPKFKELFDYENNKLSVKRNKHIYKMLLIPLIILFVFYDPIIESIPSVDLTRIVMIIIILKNLSALIDIWEFKAFNLDLSLN